jgi:hypothetical protein
MKQIVLLLLLLLSANAQSTADKPTEAQDAAKKASEKLHADAMRLVEVSGAKQRLQASLKPMLEEGRKAMMEKCPACSPAFGDEWTKRMLERVKVEDFLDVYVRVYEKYFTDEEIQELIALQNAKQDSQTLSPSPALKQKLDSVMPSVMGDSVGGCAQVGAKLGAEVGSEIEKEHPEYIKATPKPDNP